jgi:Kdo2-lipid IVA lauroyltransferase/acyltransferase
MRCWGMAPVVLLARGIARLPQWFLLGLSGLLSFLLWPLLARRRRIAAINLTLCFPELSGAERRRLLHANQRATVMGALELLRAWYAPSRSLAGLARIEGLELVRAALDADEGVLLFTGHFTCTELAARLVSEALGRPLAVVVRRNNSVCLEQAMAQARSRVFSPVLEKKDVRGLLRTLLGGHGLVYSADQNFTYQNAFVPFFGIQAATLTSTPELARRGQARVLPFWFHREADGTYRIRIEQPWTGWIEASAEQAAAIYMRELETVVRQHPEQYLWVHRRFKTRPPGEPAIY